ncbi:MAG: sigma-70 family RNA polymerase sigma factor [Planctomycetes bacterium]|nr:sigma-70 family RNA polymerase sigma factor [Planctomycetota bacterium]
MDLDETITRWRGPVAGWLAAQGLDPERADRLAQDVFADAWLGRDRLGDGWDDPGRLGAWLRGIARNKLRELRRRRGPAALPDDGVVDPRGSPDEAIARADERARVRAAVDRLPPAWAEVVWAFYFDAADTRTVAALLGTSERSVEGRLHRARRALRALLAPQRTTTAGEEGR